MLMSEFEVNFDIKPRAIDQHARALSPPHHLPHFDTTPASPSILSMSSTLSTLSTLSALSTPSTLHCRYLYQRLAINAFNATLYTVDASISALLLTPSTLHYQYIYQRYAIKASIGAILSTLQRHTIHTLDAILSGPSLLSTLFTTSHRQS
jgi:hypothetical protein